MSVELTGNTAIVTGASKGIGYAIAEAFARAGSNVVVCARNEQEITKAAATLDDLGEGRVVGIAADLRRYEDAKRLVQKTVDEFDRVDSGSPAQSGSERREAARPGMSLTDRAATG